MVDSNTIILILLVVTLGALYYCKCNKLFMFGEAPCDCPEESVVAPRSPVAVAAVEKLENAPSGVKPMVMSAKPSTKGALISSMSAKDDSDHEKYNFDPTKIMPKMDKNDKHWKPALDLSDKNLLHYNFEGPDSYSSRTLVKGTGITDIRGPVSTLLRKIHNNKGKSWYRPDSIDSNFTVADIVTVRGLHNEFDDQKDQLHWGT